MILNKENILDESIINNSKLIEDIVFDISSKYTLELDRMIGICRQILNSNQPMNDKELEDMLLLLPTYMYFTNEGMEILGIKEDISKITKNEKYNDKRKEAVGTVADKNTFAELEVVKEHLNYIIYQRCYKMIRSKIEMANELLNSLKRVNDKRLKELALSGRSN